MDFMKLLKSFEELLYEVMVMLVFFPRTLWLTLRYPQRMMDYADTELGDVQNDQYTDTLSPPLFLMMCLGLSHLISMMAKSNNLDGLPPVLQSDENILAFRVFVFSLLPLAMSLRLLHGLNVPLDRESLRAPFYSQCFFTAPVAMAVGLFQSFPKILGFHWLTAPLLTGLLCWYVLQQAYWFRSKLKVGRGRAWLIAIGATVAGIFIILLTVTITALSLGALEL